MTPTDVKRLAKQKVDALSPAKARVALDFIEFLVAKEEAEATEELLAIPGLLSQVREAEREVAEGKVVSLSEVRKRRNRHAGH